MSVPRAMYPPDTMLRGVLQGKFTLTEDQLTSTVLGYLDLLPKSVLLRWMAMARPASPHASPLRFGDDALFELHCWPRTASHGEPDVLLLVRDGDEEHAIIVEAKYGASKSQWESAVSQTDEAERSRYDQLVRYWRALEDADFSTDVRPRVLRATNRAVVYLTADASPPVAELEESVAHAPEISLHWLSWHDVVDAVHAVSHPSSTERVVMQALTRLLAFLGFRRFVGFNSAALREPVTERSWTFLRALYGTAAAPAINPALVWRLSGDSR